MNAELKLVPDLPKKRGRTEAQKAKRREVWKRDMSDPVKGPHLRALANAAERKWRAAHPDTNARRQKAWQERRRLEIQYGLSRTDYDRMIVEQNGVCAICRRPETATRRGVVARLSVDHCHTSGNVRGLLCNKCNQSIGMLSDDPLIMRAAANYIERSR